MKQRLGPTRYLARQLYNLHLNESVLRLAYKLLRKLNQPRATSRFYRGLGRFLVRYLMWAQALVVDGVEPAGDSAEFSVEPSPRAHHHSTMSKAEGGLDHKHQVLTSATAKQLLAEQEKIGVIDCLCRQIENRCSKPRKTCLLFGEDAESYVRSGRGQWLELEEAQGLIDDCQEAGLVQNAIIARGEVMGICNCCSCCCLAIIGTHFQIDSVRSSGYVARFSGNSCAGCEVCRRACPFGAINGQKGQKEISPERCRGCGFCVIRCPRENISLTSSEQLFTSLSDATKQ